MFGRLNFNSTTISVFNLGYFVEDVGTWLGLGREILKTLPILAFHVQTPDTSIIIDVPTNQSRPDMPTVNDPLFPSLAEQMAGEHIDIATVQHVIITHAHADHFDGLRVNGRVDFPQAMVWLHSADYTPNAIFQTLQKRNQLTLFSGVHQLTETVSLIPTPGETLGHTAIRIDCGEQTVYLVGDLWHDPLEFADPAHSCFWADPIQNEQSRRRLVRQMVCERNTVWASHIEESWTVEGSAENPIWHPYSKN